MAKATRHSRTRGRPVSKSVRRSQNHGRPASKSRSRVGSRSTSRSRGRSRVRSNKKKRRSNKVGGVILLTEDELFEAVEKNYNESDADALYTQVNNLFNGNDIVTYPENINIEFLSKHLKGYKKKKAPAYHDKKNNRIIVPLFETQDRPPQTGIDHLLVFTYDDASNISEIKGYYFTVFEDDVIIQDDDYIVADTFITEKIAAQEKPHFTFNVDPVSAPREPTEDDYKSYFLLFTKDIKAGKFNKISPSNQKAKLIEYDETDKSKEPDLNDYHMVYLDRREGERYYFIKNLNDDEVQKGDKNLVSYCHPDIGWFHFKKMIKKN